MKYRGHFFKSMNPLNKIREEMKGMKAATSELSKITTQLLTEKMKVVVDLANMTQELINLNKALTKQADTISAQQKLIMDLTLRIHELEKKAEQDEEYTREQSI